jgi:hypothetical protein
MRARNLLFAVAFFALLLAPVAFADPAPSGPGADCTTYDLPAGGYAERCDGDWTFRLPWGL